MALNKVTAAKITAYYIGWVDPQAFAKHAKEGSVYIQANRHYRESPFTFFVLGAGVKQTLHLQELASAVGLDLAIPINALNSDMFSTLSKIENQWYSHHHGALSMKNGVFEINIVAQVGKDSITGEIGYACYSWQSVTEIEELIKRELLKQEHNGDSKSLDLSESKIQGLMNFFTRFFADKSRWTTIKKVNQTISKIKERQATKLPPEQIFKKKIFEELSGEQKLAVLETARSLLDKKLTHDELRSQVIMVHDLLPSDLLDQFIDDIATTQF